MYKEAPIPTPTFQIPSQFFFTLSASVLPLIRRLNLIDLISFFLLKSLVSTSMSTQQQSPSPYPHVATATAVGDVTISTGLEGDASNVGATKSLARMPTSASQSAPVETIGSPKQLNKESNARTTYESSLANLSTEQQPPSLLPHEDTTVVSGQDIICPSPEGNTSNDDITQSVTRMSSSAPQRTTLTTDEAVDIWDQLDQELKALDTPPSSIIDISTEEQSPSPLLSMGSTSASDNTVTMPSLGNNALNNSTAQPIMRTPTSTTQQPISAGGEITGTSNHLENESDAHIKPPVPTPTPLAGRQPPTPPSDPQSGTVPKKSTIFPKHSGGVLKSPTNRLSTIFHTSAQEEPILPLPHHGVSSPLNKVDSTTGQSKNSENSRALQIFEQPKFTRRRIRATSSAEDNYVDGQVDADSLASPGPRGGSMQDQIALPANQMNKALARYSPQPDDLASDATTSRNNSSTKAHAARTEAASNLQTSTQQHGDSSKMKRLPSWWQSSRDNVNSIMNFCVLVLVLYSAISSTLANNRSFKMAQWRNCMDLRVSRATLSGFGIQYKIDD